jgi:spermidine/putrescine transport system substrate-binding protein
MARDRDGNELNLLIQRPGARVGRRQILRVGALLGAAGVLAGCAGDTRPSGGGQSEPATTLDDRPEDKVLNFYNWSDYIDDKTIPNYQKATGIKVNYDNYSTNEELLAKMRAGRTSYDIIVPSDSFVPTYVKLDLIQPIRFDLIPNAKNIDPTFVKPRYDPEGKYTIPWQWGTDGLGYNTTKVPGGKVDSWKALFEPDPSLDGKISMLDEVASVIGDTLIYLGKDPNSNDDADLKQVEETLRSLRPKLKKFTSDTYIDELAGNETYLAHGWSGDVYQAQDENDKVAYAIPKEGTAVFVDVMCVPKSAPHPKNAARFMNHVLDPKVAAAISGYVSYGTPVPEAKKYLPKEQVEDPSIYPPESTKLHIVTLTGPQIQKWQQTFDAVISG